MEAKEEFPVANWENTGISQRKSVTMATKKIPMGIGEEKKAAEVPATGKQRVKICHIWKRKLKLICLDIGQSNDSKNC